MRNIKEHKPKFRRSVKQKPPAVLKKLALGFVIAVFAALVYMTIANKTDEAQQRIELQKTHDQLLQTKSHLESQKSTSQEQLKQIEELNKKLEEADKALQAKRTANTAYAAAPTPVASSNNESIIWNFLIAQGFTRNQTAGIMGNLQQEHNFKTADVPGGLGIAQWIGGRRANLIAKGDYLNIHTQLNFLMEELNGAEHVAGTAIRSAGSVEAATVAFQNLFERCGLCHESQRIQYAYAILGRH